MRPLKSKLKSLIIFCFHAKKIVLIFTFFNFILNLRYILKNAENIIQFIAELLQIHSDKDEDANTDVLCICLTFLTMVLYDLRKKKDVKWDVFTALLSPLQKLKKFSLLEVRLLAEKVSNSGEIFVHRNSEIVHFYFGLLHRKDTKTKR